ncbi:hypothetical protein TVD_00675 [Thioalkalivibrio versutus]|uniref:Uncharacterized protein n=1 Tax=Thioalkalivibrio versutus TaxID=106634 RepID=A0A0G3G354_9GAMM|nr:hypothetical protein TVD_00675 [Thioalkalivibrio versutus]
MAGGGPEPPQTPDAEPWSATTRQEARRRHRKHRRRTRASLSRKAVERMRFLLRNGEPERAHGARYGTPR